MGLVAAFIQKDAYPNLVNELGSNIIARPSNTKGTEIPTLRYLAMIWQLLEAVDPALETAEVMMEYHQRVMERNDYVVVMRLLV